MVMFFLRVEKQEDIVKLILTTNRKIRATQLNAFYNLIMMT